MQSSNSCQGVVRQLSAWSGSPQIQNCQKLERFITYLAQDNNSTTQRLKNSQSLNPIRHHK